MKRKPLLTATAGELCAGDRLTPNWVYCIQTGAGCHGIVSLRSYTTRSGAIAAGKRALKRLRGR